MPEAADILDRIDRCIRELEAIKAAIAAIDGMFPQPAASNGTGNTLARLRAAAVELGVRISGDDRIGERDVARLLGIAAESLAKRRQEGRAPPSFKMPCGGSRWSYRIGDPGTWLEEHRENF